MVLRPARNVLTTASRACSIGAPILSHSSARPYICAPCQRKLQVAHRTPRSSSYFTRTSSALGRRRLQTSAQAEPFRKHLKELAKLQKRSAKVTDLTSAQSKKRKDNHRDWELAVGIEIHAELNTAQKLFSFASTRSNAAPNDHASAFDIAFPGAQPAFQSATLLPTIRAALALGCTIQTKSSWDRKHYFHWDQPQGYQITQYYEPFAKGGHITLFEHDGIDREDGEQVIVGIKQVQMEQDTAKTVQQPPRHLLDFNRVSHPLIEIITMPQIHSPLTAAACVRKIQATLNAVGAVTAGMEIGGLRADVNVSVRRRHSVESNEGFTQSYAGITGLGTRTEIKNLSSLKAVEDAIIAERDRQIGVLEAGGVIVGETRGWTIGQSETTKLRGKEGEVDYRYMPDPDLAPLIIGDDLVQHLQRTLPRLPDEQIALLTSPSHGLSMTDAQTLVILDEGDRLEYYLSVVDCLTKELKNDEVALTKTTKAAANWVLHQMGKMLAVVEMPWHDQPVTPKELASLLSHLLRNQITSKTAKELFERLFVMEKISDGAVERIIHEEDFLLRPMDDEEYASLASHVLSVHPEVAEAARATDKRAAGKFMFLVGRMMNLGPDGRVEAEKAKAALRKALDSA